MVDEGWSPGKKHREQRSKRQDVDDVDPNERAAHKHKLGQDQLPATGGSSWLQREC